MTRRFQGLHHAAEATDAEARTAREHFQAKLLRRMVHHERVRSAQVDCAQLVPELREQAQAWLAPIRDCLNLVPSVMAALSRRSREVAGQRFSDLKCIALEAALFQPHNKDTTHFFVGDVAEKMNLLLQGRHEDTQVSAKRAGAALGDLGIISERVAKGFKVTLSDAVRRQIHDLAHAYRIASTQDGIARCEDCPGERTL